MKAYIWTEGDQTNVAESPRDVRFWEDLEQCSSQGSSFCSERKGFNWEGHFDRRYQITIFAFEYQLG